MLHWNIGILLQLSTLSVKFQLAWAIVRDLVWCFRLNRNSHLSVKRNVDIDFVSDCPQGLMLQDFITHHIWKITHTLIALPIYLDVRRVIYGMPWLSLRHSNNFSPKKTSDSISVAAFYISSFDTFRMHLVSAFCCIRAHFKRMQRNAYSLCDTNVR